jgi:predicted Abi (CAAX) family protease
MMLSTLSKLSKSLIIATFFNLTFTNFGLTESPRQSLTADQPNHIIADTVTNPDHTLAPLYRPISDWVGRLILPEAENNPETDWVWIELTNVPPEYADLAGKQVRLQWSDHATLQEYLNLVTVDINFTPLTEKQLEKGIIVPTRLNGRRRVGPLQSLAGARPADDMMVKLNQVTVSNISGETVLNIGVEPVQVTGSLYGLVQFIAPVDSPTADGSQYYRVRHYNQATGNFDGPMQVIKFPAVQPDRNGILRFTPKDLEKSPAGQGGWYIYGAMNTEDEFVVRAIAPRDLFELTPKRIIFGEEEGMKFLQQTGWRNLRRTRGEINRVLIDPDTQTEAEALREWQEGERYLLIHLYGAVGSSTYSPSFFGIVSGHFSFGVATVVRDPFTNNLKFDIEYQQVFTHNDQGIIAGAATWANYMGDIQRGWLGNIPVMDAIVKLGDYSPDYRLGSLPFTPLDELLKQLSIINARYRSGDGTGISMVTPSTSCVQDSNQALFLTLQAIDRQVRAMPEALTWMKNNPEDPATQQFERLVNLGRDIDKTLTPLGIVRADWQQNANVLAGVGTGNTNASFVRSPASLAEALLSKGTMSPRAAQENLIEVFLRHDAEIWLLQTNQVGGRNDDSVPYAPTLVVN